MKVHKRETEKERFANLQEIRSFVYAIEAPSNGFPNDRDEKQSQCSAFRPFPFTHLSFKHRTTHSPKINDG